jgi:hypothetical protein
MSNYFHYNLFTDYFYLDWHNVTKTVFEEKKIPLIFILPDKASSQISRATFY